MRVVTPHEKQTNKKGKTPERMKDGNVLRTPNNTYKGRGHDISRYRVFLQPRKIISYHIPWF